MKERLFYLNEEKRAGLRKEIGSFLARVKFNRKSRLRQDLAPAWSQPELDALVPWAEKVKAKELSYYAACGGLTKELKGVRSFEAIRKKLKNYVNYGHFGFNDQTRLARRKK